jgi:dephospho-CoA kinase
MLKIAITGGIGTGKTTVCSIFETLQIPVFNADAFAKKIMQENAQIIDDVKLLLGEAAYDNNELQTKYIAESVFENTAKLHALNAIVHPHVINHLSTWFNNQTAAYAIYESALIIENKLTHLVDYIIGVQAPMAIRKQRIEQRNNITEAEIEKRMANQLPEKEKEIFYDYTIVNDNVQALIPQVLHIHQTLLNQLNGNA